MDVVSNLDQVMLSRFTMLKTVLMVIDEVVIFKVGHQLTADNFFQ